MKIFIIGYGNVGKTLAEFCIKNKYKTFVLSSQERTNDHLTFLTLEDANNFKETNDVFLVSTVPPNKNKEDFILKNFNIDILKKFKKIIYISSTSVYPKGNVNELTKITNLSKKSKIRFDIENQWKRISNNVFIIRPGGIYSSQNNIMIRYLSGNQKVIYKANHTTNRIHIDDLVGIIFKTFQSDLKSKIINAVDKNSYNTFNLIKFICKELNLPNPKKLDYRNKNISSRLRMFYEVSKKVKSVVIENELNYKFQHPDSKKSLINITRELIKNKK